MKSKQVDATREALKEQLFGLWSYDTSIEIIEALEAFINAKIDFALRDHIEYYHNAGNSR